MEKWPFFDQNHVFGKISIFRLFELLVFIAYRGVISFWNIVKHIFLAYIAWKKKIQKWAFLDQIHGLTPLEKSQFFDFLNFLFLWLRKAFYLCRISLNTFFGLCCLKEKDGNMASFCPKRWVNPFGKISIHQSRYRSI